MQSRFLGRQVVGKAVVSGLVFFEKKQYTDGSAAGQEGLLKW